VIDKRETTFLSGRGMLDMILVTKETMDYLKKEKNCGLVVKVDYEKTKLRLNGLEFFVLHDG